MTVKKKQHIGIFIVVLITCIVCFYFLLQTGKTLEGSKNILSKQTSFSLIDELNYIFKENISHPFAILLFQIFSILFAARTFGYIFNKLGQPTVIGEIVAGIVLGPSIMGLFLPEVSLFLFPVESLKNLQLLSQVGLILFMFVIGMELDVKAIKNNTSNILIISNTSIVIPYTLAILLSYFIYDEFAPQGVSFLSFALFMGISLSIAAFPVLARIIHERNLTKTKIGVLALTCAAADDVLAWCILAIVIATVNAGSFAGATITILFSALYLFTMIKFVQPFLKKFGEVYSNKESLNINIIGTIFGILLLSSLITESLGIHALFGAFMAGAIMPPSINFRRLLIEKVESISLGLMLPIFFAFIGLNTNLNLLNNIHLMEITLLLIVTGVIGKFGGTIIGAKIAGYNLKDSLSLGALMNTRGVIQIVIISVGLELGVFSPEIFVMMVLMVIVTTFMTGPSLDLIKFIYRKDEEEITSTVKRKFRVLLSFANPSSGKKLVRVANLISGYSKNSTEIMALHVTPTADFSQYQLAEYEKESFKPIKFEANKLGLTIKTSYKVSNDVSDEILNDANSGSYDIMLVGVGQSVFQGTLLGQFIGITANALSPDKLLGTLTGRSNIFKTQKILDEKSNAFINGSKIPVGIFIDHELDSIEKVLLPILSISDVFLLFYAKKIIKNSNVVIAILDYNGIIDANTEIKEEIHSLENFAPANIQLISRKTWSMENLKEYNLTILSIDGFGNFSTDLEMEEKDTPSFLLIRP